MFATPGLTQLRKGYIMSLTSSPSGSGCGASWVPRDGRATRWEGPVWSHGGKPLTKWNHSPVRWDVKFWCAVPLNFGDLFVIAAGTSITYASTWGGLACGGKEARGGQLAQKGWWGLNERSLERCSMEFEYLPGYVFFWESSWIEQHGSQVMGLKCVCGAGKFAPRDNWKWGVIRA